MTKNIEKGMHTSKLIRRSFLILALVWDAIHLMSQIIHQNLNLKEGLGVT